MSRVCLVGQRRWVEQLRSGLTPRLGNVAAVGVESGKELLSPTAIRALREADLVLRVGLRSGGATWRGALFDALMASCVRRDAIRVMYWIGTDVANLASDNAHEIRVAGWRRGQRLIDVHLAGSELLASELKDAAVKAAVVDFPSFVTMPENAAPPLPATPAVLTYIPDGRSDFYGGPIVLALAKRFPEVTFNVMGGLGGWAVDCPPNVRFHGWVNDPASLFAEATVVLRLPEHDSWGATAAEGLLFGREVLYSIPMPHTVFVPREVDAVSDALTRILANPSGGARALNLAGAEWARSFFDPDRRFDALAAAIREAIERPARSSRA